MSKELGLRADAQRNRDQIVAAAQIHFRESGFDVPMEEIARGAGVGVGTLYRRFPDRDSLIWATAQAVLRDLADMAETAWREEPDAWAALCRFLRGCAERRLGALASAIEPRLHASIQSDPELRSSRQTVSDLVERMTAAAKADGAMRPDVSPAEVGLLMTVRIYTPSDMSDDQAMRRVVDIVLDGLRTGREPDPRKATQARSGCR